MIDPNDDPLLKPGEVARLFRVDTKTVTRWAHDRRLTSVRTPGGHRRYLEKEIREFLEQRELAQNPLPT